MSDEKGKFEEIGRSVGALVDSKDRAYGSAFERMGRVLTELFPNGIRPEQYANLAGIIRVEDKLFRIATDQDAFGEDPWRDVAGYGVLGTERRQRERRKPTNGEPEAILKKEVPSEERGSILELPLAIRSDAPTTAGEAAREMPSDFDPENRLHVELLAAATYKPETEPERTEAVMDGVRRGKPSPAAWARLARAARAFAGREGAGLGDALLLQASEMREVMEAAKAEERARCVAIALAEEALWREEGAKPVEQRNMLASTQAVMAAEATAGRIAAAMEVETKSKETPAAYVALRSAQEVTNAAEDQLRFERAVRMNLNEQVDHRNLALAEAVKREHAAIAKLDVAANRAAAVVLENHHLPDLVRQEVAAAVRRAALAELVPDHQSALATLQHDVQKADQRTDKAAARAAELEVLLEKERRPVRCRLCKQNIAPGTMVSATTDGRVVHSTCQSQPVPRSGAL